VDVDVLVGVKVKVLVGTWVRVFVGKAVNEAKVGGTGEGTSVGTLVTIGVVAVGVVVSRVAGIWLVNNGPKVFLNTYIAPSTPKQAAHIRSPTPMLTQRRWSGLFLGGKDGAGALSCRKIFVVPTRDFLSVQVPTVQRAGFLVNVWLFLCLH
jgi:hypothetical protein